MKIKFLQAAAVIIEHENVKILCDPWLVDGEYYGSWSHYPPYNFKPENFEDIDYIYISHVHPDHCSTKTLAHLNKNIPVLIHDFPAKYLKRTIEGTGFSVTELEHDKRTHLKNNLHINIVAADNCDPRICGAYIGCTFDETQKGAIQMDTISVIDNGNENIVNINDCPFPIAEQSAKLIKNEYKKIDLLLLGYGGALAFPQCFDFPEAEYEKIIKEMKKRYFGWGENFINIFKPRYFFPFAGRHALSGKLSNLNKHRCTPELEEGFQYLVSKFDQNKHKGIILNSDTCFDLTSGKTEKAYTPISKERKRRYIEDILSKRQFDYEKESVPRVEELMKLVPESYKRFDSKLNQFHHSSDYTVLLDFPKNKMLAVSCNGNGYDLINFDEKKKFEKFIRFKIDPRLLKWLLQGPKKANWNNAELGSHIRFEREPDFYDRGLHYCLNFLHS